MTYYRVQAAIKRAAATMAGLPRKSGDLSAEAHKAKAGLSAEARSAKAGVA
jgi:hypothetical protein